MDYEIRQLLFDDGDVSLQKVVDLQNAVYEGSHIFNVNKFRQWYLKNPMGNVISFNAFYGDELVAHYACIPYKMEIAGRVVTGLFDMATVTHPDHRGKGLFKKLAKVTYDFAKEQGYEFVLGVANANSFSGYMKYFPFTFVGQLEVKIGFGTKIMSDGEKTFKVHWDKDSFNWRLNTCKANYSRKNNSIIGYLIFTSPISASRSILSTDRSSMLMSPIAHSISISLAETPKNIGISKSTLKRYFFKRRTFRHRYCQLIVDAMHKSVHMIGAAAFFLSVYGSYVARTAS